MSSTMLFLAAETSVLLAETPVVDIDNTVFIQAGLFLFLMFVLNFMLFKPWLEVRDRRAARIGGALEEAARLREAAGEREQDYDTRLAKAREQAIELRSDSRREAEGEEARIVGEARREAANSLDQTKAQLATEVDAARVTLGARVDALAGDITKQVLGRPA
ncbi:MAG: ATP synthase F0 subunit B [Myxococcales bacterium]|nr:ATP synthase F0 subunit B [Myxococcales bacterium]